MKRFFYFLFSFIILSSILISFYIQSSFEIIPERKIKLQGHVEEIIKQDKNSLVFRINDFYIKTKPDIGLKLGDELKIIGKLEIQVINSFYLQHWLIFPDIVIVKKFSHQSFTHQILKYPFILVQNCILDLKSILQKKLVMVFDEDKANLISGMILGTKSSLSPVTYEKMQKSGLLHLVVASGGNIILVSTITMLLLQNLSRNLKYLFSFFLIFIYAILAGLEAPIVRATIMLSLVWLAKLMGRKTASVGVLLITGSLMLIFDPFLIFSVSFQLSFTATLAILVFGGKLDLIFSKITSYKIFSLLDFIRADFSQSLAVQLLLIPLLLNIFGKTSLLSIFANILVAPVVAPVMYAGVIVLFFSFVFLPLARGIAFLISPLLGYVYWVSEFFASFSIGNITFNLPWFLVFLIWGLIFYFFTQIKLDDSL